MIRTFDVKFRPSSTFLVEVNGVAWTFDYVSSLFSEVSYGLMRCEPVTLRRARVRSDTWLVKWDQNGTATDVLIREVTADGKTQSVGWLLRDCWVMTYHQSNHTEEAVLWVKRIQRVPPPKTDLGTDE